METLDFLQRLATTPRYGQHFSQLIAAQSEAIQQAFMHNDSAMFNKQIWDEGAFQANITIQVDVN